MGSGGNGGYLAPEPGTRFHGALSDLGAPVRQFLYRNAAGHEAVWVCRYAVPAADEAPAEDESTLLTRYWVRSSSNLEWVPQRGVPKPVLPYQFHLIVGRPAWPVYILDTEESAEALQGLLTGAHVEAVASTWMGGLACLKAVDWEAVQDRLVTLWPTHRLPSLSALAQLGGRLVMQGCEVLIADPRDAAPPYPPDWNAHQAVTDGWTWERVQQFLMDTQRELGEAPATPPKGTAVSATQLAPESGQPVIERAAGGTRAEKWRQWGFETNAGGVAHQNLANVVRFIESQKGAYGDVWFDEFHCRIMQTLEGVAVPWGDEDTIELQRILQTDYAGLHKVAKSTVHDAIVACAFKHKRHEYREWLKSLTWDGEPRLETVFPLGWGTLGNHYHREAGRCFLMQAVARVLRPGCQADLMFVFEGATGIGKTTALQTLFGEKYVDNPTTRFGHKDFYQGLLGKVCIEIADFANAQGVHLDQIKADVTRKSDRFRPPYAAIPVDYPRQCVFAATTERDDWNQDEMVTARRFPPVACEASGRKIDQAWLKANREPLFAEAVVRVERGEPWWDMPAEETAEQQAARATPDVYDPLVARYAEAFTEMTMDKVLQFALGIEDKAKWDMRMMKRVGFILRKLGWERVNRRQGPTIFKVWRRKNPYVQERLRSALEEVQPHSSSQGNGHDDGSRTVEIPPPGTGLHEF